MQDSARVQALNGMRDGAWAQAFNGIQDGSRTQALNGLKDQARSGSSNDPLASWITSDPALQSERLELAHYVVQCAMPPGDDRTVTVDGKTHTFRGVFGLLPVWASGEPMTNAENQVLAACLGAHVNPLGVHVPISIRGPGVRVDPGEPELFPVREGAFFALPNGDGALTTYACAAEYVPHEGDDSRFCTQPGGCRSVVGLGPCSGICQIDDEGNFRCARGGVEMPGVLTTFMKPREAP